MAVNKREAISKRTRFEVFKRDCFTCQYCGSQPPKVVLEIDHVIPVARGGKNGLNNLLTACFDCNRGKGAVSLEAVPSTLVAQAEMAAEKLAQLKAFERLLKATRKHEDSQIDDVQEAFKIHYSGYSFSPKFRESVRRFIQALPSHVVIGNMHTACSRIRNMNDATKYFCGICWKQIKADS